eukprot:CAMPEP_0204831008 /NCGR_PEP_ID=MMETSP1346-20131115/9624_1 /ASSEMBLY_ACC=CAM_ASM_000771 /TAXON_ID=215587 /ORGANISM="Aplanochytrium stocchinoi, Strain GSBS06" /LENGTH=514 /DNA_ID=CAMNT_0051961669 /DNA_START=285 /DNA_END=1829 /DNA_ORIENTATION=+
MDKSKKASTKCLVFCYGGIGHMNPQLNILSALCKKGVDVVVFGSLDAQEEIENTGASFRYRYEGVVKALGETKEDFDEDRFLSDFKDQLQMSDDDKDIFSLNLVVENLILTEYHLSAVKTLSPDMILWDTFCLSGYMCSTLLAIKGAALITYSGLGIFSDPACPPKAGMTWTELAETDTMKEYGNKFRVKYGLNPFVHVAIMQAYSPNLNIVTLIEEMTMKLPKDENDINYKLFSGIERDTLRYVGPCISSSHRMTKNKGAKVALDEVVDKVLQKAKIERRKIIFFSLGTVVTTKAWTEGANIKIGGASCGRELFYTLNNRLIEVVGDNEEYFVISAVGPLAEIALLPQRSNFLYKEFVNQLQVLKYADVFISHCGAGSTSESVVNGVPVIPVPGFADQSFNANLLLNNGAGVLLWDSLDVINGATSAKLKQAIETALLEETKEKAKHLQQATKTSGGHAKAADILIQYASSDYKPKLLQKRTSSSCAVLHRQYSSGASNHEIRTFDGNLPAKC